MILLVTCPFVETAFGATGNKVDSTLYAELLARYVKNGVVDYRCLASAYVREPSKGRVEEK